jgi:hypothetical protein
VLNLWPVSAGAPIDLKRIPLRLFLFLLSPVVGSNERMTSRDTIDVLVHSQLAFKIYGRISGLSCRDALVLRLLPITVTLSLTTANRTPCSIRAVTRQIFR